MVPEPERGGPGAAMAAAGLRAALEQRLRELGIAALTAEHPQVPGPAPAASFWSLRASADACEKGRGKGAGAAPRVLCGFSGNFFTKRQGFGAERDRRRLLNI